MLVSVCADSRQDPCRREDGAVRLDDDFDVGVFTEVEKTFRIVQELDSTIEMMPAPDGSSGPIFSAL